MSRREISVGIIGCGLMGRELASAAGRWCHLLDLDFVPRIAAVCDLNEQAVQWFSDNVPGIELATSDYKELLACENVEVVYCAVPHNLHEQMYVDVIEAGKHLLGEKPFGIDQKANTAILEAISAHENVLVRCSSEFPFHPGSRMIADWVGEGRFGRIIEVEAGFWHSSDLDPNKAINWKRMIDMNGEYGSMGDLGMHVVHMPFRFGWMPKNVRALLSNIMPRRPDGKGETVPCETWDNAILACEAADSDGAEFPTVLSTKRIAPGEGNTWFIRIMGTKLSAEFTTKNPKQIRFLDYEPGGIQSWQELDLPHKPPYASITGGIFEFGFSDGMLQMLAAFLDELVHGENMKQPFTCATPQEAAQSHALFTAALESNRTGHTISLEW
ncbi:Gfo/Idh/MocA family protein [Planctomycetota bacterium]